MKYIDIVKRMICMNKPETVLYEEYSTCTTKGRLKSLKTELGKTVSVVDCLDDMTGFKLKNNELLKGELSAVIYDFGIYTVRIANCIFHDSHILNGCYIPGSEKPEPASEEEIKALGEIAFQPSDYSYRRATEVSVRVKNSGEGFMTVCYCSESRPIYWTESLGFVGTVKEHIFSPDKSSVLYICKVFVGSSNTIKYWYAVYPDGIIKAV